MEIERRKQEEEVILNHKVFCKVLPDLLAKNLYGQYALMHNGEIKTILKDFHDAIIMGNEIFEDKPFSVQHIVDEPINLGSYSYL